jgi:hypothetical protein
MYEQFVQVINRIGSKIWIDSADVLLVASRPLTIIGKPHSVEPSIIGTDNIAIQHIANHHRL